MSKGRISVDVDLNGVTEKIEKQIKKGMKDSPGELADQGIPVAKDKILEEGAIWKGELFSSFEWDKKRASSGNLVKLEIKNVSPHAAPMEEGAEFNDEGPPIASLMPWVKTELADWQVSDFWIWKAEQTFGLYGMSPERKKLYGKAYWLQQHIKREGLEARRFMEAMERYLEKHADEIVAGEINKALNNL